MMTGGQAAATKEGIAAIVRRQMCMAAAMKGTYPDAVKMLRLPGSERLLWTTVEAVLSAIKEKYSGAATGPGGGTSLSVSRWNGGFFHTCCALPYSICILLRAYYCSILRMRII